MKILFYQQEESEGNPYLIEMARILENKGLEIFIGSSDFWKKKGDYDLINLQWPEELFKWKEPTDSDIQLLKETLEYWQGRSKIVVTRHNVIPHNHHNNTQYNKLYLTVFNYASGVIHMGEFSREEYLNRYQDQEFITNQVHGIVPHPIYTVYEDTVTQEQARQTLGIPLNKTVILIFGKLRNKQEKKLIKRAFSRLKVKNKYLLISYYRLEKFKGSRYLNPIIKFWLNIKPNQRKHFNQVPFSKVQLFLRAADVLFIQRKDNLNSGLVFLGFAFSKVIVGPGVTNINKILQDTKNYIFDPNHLDSAVNALETACHELPDNETTAKNIKEHYPSEESIGISYKIFARKVLGIKENQSTRIVKQL